MVDLDHLPLPEPSLPTPRRKQRPRTKYERFDRDNSKFQKDRLNELQLLKKTHEKNKIKFGNYLDPRLIFKIKTNQYVYESNFRQDLERAGIQVLNSSTANPGYWIAFSNDSEFKEFKMKLQKHHDDDRYKYFLAIDEIVPIPVDEKIGRSLNIDQLPEMGFEFLDVEVWRMEDSELDQFLSGFENWLKENNCLILDNLITINFCILRVRISKRVLNEILALNEIALVDRPPTLEVESLLMQPIEKEQIIGPPNENCSSIAILDSGILKHPILEDAIKDYIKFDDDEEIGDHSGHGTSVASICLYGDVEKCIRDSRFEQKIWLYSLKIIFKQNKNRGNEYNKLLENRLKELVEKTIQKDPNCKIFNVSIAIPHHILKNDVVKNFNLAVLLDELAKKYNIIFVISIGNNTQLPDSNYPDHLLALEENRLLNPASSALSLTVGGIVSRLTRIDSIDVPSPITRVGPGFKGMIKPELVEYSGGGFGNESDVIIANAESVGVIEGRPFKLGKGTSFSAPRISHYLALLRNQYPFYSSNMLKCLLLSSSRIPIQRPGFLSEISEDDTETNLMKLLNVYGYGKPDISKALYSDNYRVLLIKESKLQINSYHIYEINLPQDVFDEYETLLSITLTYDPPIRKNRINYLGVAMEFHLYHNLDMDDLNSSLSADIDKEYPDDEIQKIDIKKNEIMLKPGINIRKKGVHQKGIRIIKPHEISSNKPLLLSVVSRDLGWIENVSYEQDYSIIVAIEQVNNLKLYNAIKLRNRVRVRS
ncbi:S8 family peptidase [Candidatus Nitrosocosmicus franklandus]|uniref:Peptidase S8/S53 domain-containing protein n=1 Tax=Candidatus Nitrosocosmicus franklandianus TaxID=1798806 RepID=A0A484I8H1_9ARCH|nr:S8 family peptidase [Candidatus Nitrosocosmicus franklandus]VFJ14051.1 conserved protein of unknown function [Candidatus Nitrosocosmicus franklandus]